MEGGEKENRMNEMSKRKRVKRGKTSDLQDLLIILAGFLSFAFGLLLLLLPENYPISTLPTSYNPLVGIVLIIVGLYLILRSMD